MVSTYEQLKALSRRTHIPVRQHHVIAYRAHGRVYFRVSAQIPHDRMYYCQSIHRPKNRAVWRLTFIPVPEGTEPKRRLVPSRGGTEGLNFFDSQFTSMVVPPDKDHVRLRIVKRTRIGHKGHFRLYLSASPVRDMLSIWQDMNKGL